MPRSREIDERGPTVGQRLRQWAGTLKKEVTALYLALRHPETPLYAKVVVALVIGYALSPIDLIPDFIPVLGYLDDLILLPLGIALAIRLIPAHVMEACRAEAERDPPAEKPKLLTGACVIVALWVLFFYFLYRWIR